MADYESTLLTIPRVFAYRIPPRNSARGYLAAEWQQNKHIWSGSLKVTSKGSDCIISLVHTDKPGVYAKCTLMENGTNNVEPVTDSGRFFALRISDGKGRHAFIGIGFNEKKEAFDFKASLSEVTRHENNMNNADFNDANLSDLSLSGKIKVNLKSSVLKSRNNDEEEDEHKKKKKKKRKKKKDDSSDDSDSEREERKKKKEKKKKKKEKEKQGKHGGDIDFFAGGGAASADFFAGGTSSGNAAPAASSGEVGSLEDLLGIGGLSLGESNSQSSTAPSSAASAAVPDDWVAF